MDKGICLTRGARVPAKCQFEGIIYLPILLWLGLLVEGRGFVFKLTLVKLIFDSTTWMVDTNRNEIAASLQNHNHSVVSAVFNPIFQSCSSHS